MQWITNIGITYQITTRQSANILTNILDAVDWARERLMLGICSPGQRPRVQSDYDAKSGSSSRILATAMPAVISAPRLPLPAVGSPSDLHRAGAPMSNLGSEHSEFTSAGG